MSSVPGTAIIHASDYARQHANATIIADTVPSWWMKVSILPPTYLPHAISGEYLTPASIPFYPEHFLYFAYYTAPRLQPLISEAIDTFGGEINTARIGAL